jgi:hypothetical protein
VHLEGLREWAEFYGRGLLKTAWNTTVEVLVLTLVAGTGQAAHIVDFSSLSLRGFFGTWGGAVVVQCILFVKAHPIPEDTPPPS